MQDGGYGQEILSDIVKTKFHTLNTVFKEITFIWECNSEQYKDIYSL